MYIYVVEGHKNAEQICSTIVTKTTKQAKVGRFRNILHKKICSVRNIIFFSSEFYVSFHNLMFQF